MPSFIHACVPVSAACPTLAGAPGNPNPALHFHTRSGVLTVKRKPSPGSTASQPDAVHLEMALPLVTSACALPACLAAGAASPLVKAVVGDLVVDAVRWAGSAWVTGYMCCFARLLLAYVLS